MQGLEVFSWGKTGSCRVRDRRLERTSSDIEGGASPNGGKRLRKDVVKERFA